MSKLSEYKKRRDFKESKEPQPKKSKSKKNIFVIQRHDARNLHFDFRIEILGVLKSWAVPKGIPDKDEKKLAILTEDHPIEYADFEGIIPEGNYGAGTVEIFDKGKYENLREISIEKSFKQGQIEIFLKGKKINDKFALMKLKPNRRYPAKNSWLMIRMK